DPTGDEVRRARVEVQVRERVDRDRTLVGVRELPDDQVEGAERGAGRGGRGLDVGDRDLHVVVGRVAMAHRVDLEEIEVDSAEGLRLDPRGRGVAEVRLEGVQAGDTRDRRPAGRGARGGERVELVEVVAVGRVERRVRVED